MTLVRASGLVIFRKVSNQIEYLLLKASYGAHHWTSPKGHLDEGEDEHLAAVREVEEETGLKGEDYCILENFKKIINYDVKNKPKQVTYWLAKLKNPEQKIILSDEHEDYKWLPIQETLAYVKFDTAIDLFETCHEFLLQNSSIV